MNGAPLPPGSNDLRDMVAYISWLSKGSVSGARQPGSGIDSLVPLQPDTTRGRTSYLLTCARCHGMNGEGVAGKVVTASGPPLWGPGSFNIGSGMARVRVIAAFVHRNMPFDQPGTVDAQTAFDVAGFVSGRTRPDFVGKALDWPKGDAPPDAAYATSARKQ